LLLLVSVLVGLGLVECGYRLYSKEWNFGNYIQQRWDFERSAYHSTFDPNLGWLPQPGQYGGEKGRKTFTIGADNIRSNENAMPETPKGQVLAVGDSFTFGSEVSDDETWPAVLERISGLQVVNGGVSAFGVDQSYLRLQQLLSVYEPTIVVFSLIPDDINRSQFSRKFGADKPYFVVSEDSSLSLKTDHITPEIFNRSLDTFRYFFGYSYVMDSIFSRLAGDYWLGGGRLTDVKVHSDGVVIACKLFSELDNYSVTKNVPVFVLVQYPFKIVENQMGLVDKALECLGEHSLEIVDLRHQLLRLQENNPLLHQSYYSGHMTEKGNQFVAEILLKAIH
jgi:hypothetical protein